MLAIDNIVEITAAIVPEAAIERGLRLFREGRNFVGVRVLRLAQPIRQQAHLSDPSFRHCRADFDRDRAVRSRTTRRARA
jgi:hypothetical protein